MSAYRSLDSFIARASWSTPKSASGAPHHARILSSRRLFTAAARGTRSWSAAPPPPTHSTTFEIEHRMGHRSRSIRGAPWYAPMLTPQSLKHARGRCSECCSALASLHRRGAFAGRPSAAHGRASVALPQAPHSQSPNVHRGGSVGGPSVRPACAAGGSEHANPSDDRECLTLGIPEVKTR
jgi:hypothetical protein